MAVTCFVETEGSDHALGARVSSEMTEGARFSLGGIIMCAREQVKYRVNWVTRPGSVG